MSDQPPPPSDAPRPPPPPRAPYSHSGGYSGSGYPPYGGSPYDPYGPGGYGHPHAGWPAQEPRGGPGKAGFVLGIIALAAALSCFGSVLGLPLGVLAVVFGVTGRRRARRGEAFNGRQALTGAILGAVAIAVSLAMVALIAVEFDRDGTDRPQVALTSVRGTRSLPLGPDGTAAFRDGTWVTVSAVGAFTPPAGADGYTAGDAAYRFTVTVRDTGIHDLDLGDYEYEGTAGADRTDVRLISTATGALSEDFPGSLRPGGAASVVFAFDVPRGLRPLEFDFQPSRRHQDAYWRLTPG